MADYTAHIDLCESLIKGADALHALLLADTSTQRGDLATTARNIQEAQSIIKDAQSVLKGFHVAEE